MITTDPASEQDYVDRQTDQLVVMITTWDEEDQDIG